MELMMDEEIAAQRLQVLRDLFADKITMRSAAERLAAVTLTDNVLYRWIDAIDDEGKALAIHNMTLWKDLPLLGWDLREELDTVMSSSIPRAEAMTEFTNFHRFLAMLMATEEPVFNYSWFALVALRSALETPVGTLYSFPADKAEPWIRAASAWIEIMGFEIFGWDENFATGAARGAPGSGGPLWNGKHGFCMDRWGFWRQRFVEIATMEGVFDEQTRKAAEEAEIMMSEIQSGQISHGDT
nr:hypothetical protein CFP56_69038 [Quercus suber]